MVTEPATGASASVGSGVRASSGRRLRIFAAIFVPFFLILVICAAGIGSWEKRRAESALQKEITDTLTQKARAMAHRVDTDHSHQLGVIASQEGRAAGARATIIDRNANVVADSQIPIAELQDEGRRQEFATALRGTTGAEARSRNGVRVLFVAVPVSGGAVRLACPLADIEIASDRLTKRTVAVSAGLALVGLVVSAAIAHKVSTGSLA
jgi:hypothetical protein